MLISHQAKKRARTQKGKQVASLQVPRVQYHTTVLPNTLTLLTSSDEIERNRKSRKLL
jgi:hypothetical protein